MGAWLPAERQVDSGWGAWDGPRLAGALLLVRSGAAVMIHGPVVMTSETASPDEAAGGAPGATPGDALDVAAQLVEEALAQAAGRGVDTLFTRPQGLDPVWVRLGFIPVPEVALPRGLRGAPGLGLFAWRGGSAIWSAAGRAAPPPGSRRRAR
ncbi:MAG: hypothetical protein ABW020_16355 [Candidatus Rokuibacteriota bacterium]